MYGLKIPDMDQVSFGPVPVLMGVKFIWSTGMLTITFVFVEHWRSVLTCHHLFNGSGEPKNGCHSIDMSLFLILDKKYVFLL